MKKIKKGQKEGRKKMNGNAHLQNPVTISFHHTIDTPGIMQIHKSVLED